MEETIQKLLSNGKGILAADESLPSIEKRFQKISLPSTEENRRAYREVLLNTQGLSEYISGVILFDETLRQNTTAGTPFGQLLLSEGIVLGIKVDLGTKPLANFAGEKITEGLDGLAQRFKSYYEMGARFSKWRAVFDIAENIPSAYAISANAHVLARFASASQEANIVPIVEPEVLMDGAHNMEKCEEVTQKVHTVLFDTLKLAKVKFECVILKTNMIVPGKKSGQSVSPEEVATATLRCFKTSVPTSIPGVVLLSGGLDDIVATQYLNAIAKQNNLSQKLTFSFGRALQNKALTTWAGKEENKKVAQEELLKRAKLNGLAQSGKYESEI